MQLRIRVGVFLFISVVAHARIDVLSEQKISWTPSPEEIAQNPLLSHLRDFVVDSRQLRIVTSEGENFAYEMSADFRTRSFADLNSFGVVQFLRGCRFQSYVDAQSRVVKEIDWAKKEQFGKEVPYIFPAWTVDSYDHDPLFFSNDEPQTYEPLREALYRWNTVEGSHENKTEKYLYQERPLTPGLYVKDFPPTSFLFESPRYRQGLATNSSLQYEICLFETAKVPLQMPARGFDDSGAVKCVRTWDSFVYNFSQKRFESPQNFDDFCHVRQR